MRQRIELLRRRCAGSVRVFAALIAGVCLAACLFSLMQTVEVVTVTDTESGGTHTLLTTSKQPRELVQMAGLSTSRYDKVVYTTGADNSPQVVIHRAFPVSVLADGLVASAEFAEGTVQDLLEHCGVELGEHDYVQPAMDTPLAEDLVVEVFRVTFAQELRREELAPEVVAEYRARLDPAIVFVESYNCQYDVLYRDRFVNGELESSELLEITPVIAPRPADSYEFFPGVPCSRITGFDDIQMGADGLPVNHTGMWEGAVCTAYSSSGGKGASGLGLYCGTVAVNPGVIPYGSRLFITSADGSFVYGFAIATDTGTAMMEGHVGLDLYFETNAECYAFGKRALNVYFLD